MSFFFVILLAPFLGASPTTSASILVEFGGDDWAAGCGVAHVFSHMYISPAVRYTPHANKQKTYEHGGAPLVRPCAHRVSARNPEIPKKYKPSLQKTRQKTAQTKMPALTETQNIATEKQVPRSPPERACLNISERPIHAPKLTQNEPCLCAVAARANTRTRA